MTIFETDSKGYLHVELILSEESINIFLFRLKSWNFLIIFLQLYRYTSGLRGALVGY